MNTDVQHRLYRWIGAGLAAALAAASTQVACSGARTQPGPALTSSAQPASGTSAPAAPDAAGGSAGQDAGAVDAAASDPAAELQARATAARQCAQPGSVLLNLPDGGIVFNNAMTSVDAGFIDRTQGVLDAIVAQRVPIRCCFDAGAADGSEVTAMMVLTLAPDGQVTEIALDPQRSSSLPAVVGACLQQVLAGQTYPPSPTGKVTTVQYGFKVQQRNGADPGGAP